MKNQRFAKNHSELARLIGESRQWVAIAAKRENAPTARDDGRHDVEAWKKFRDETKQAVEETPELAELKRLIAAEDLRKKKQFNDEQDKLTVRKEDIAREAGPTLSAIVSLTYQKFGNEAPMAMAGMDVPTARIHGNRYADELVAMWRDLFKKWGI